MHINKILTFSIKDAPLRAGIYFYAGGLFQPLGYEGIAHLAEHAISAKISENYPELNFGAYTTKDMMYFTFLSYDINFINKYLMKIINDVTSLEIVKKVVDSQNEVIENELSNFSLDYPNTNQTKLHDFLSSGIFYSKNKGLVEGSEKTRASININDLNNFRSAFIHTFSSVVIVGDKVHINSIDNIEFAKQPDAIKNLSTNSRLVLSMNKSIDNLVDKNRLKLDSPINYIGIGWKVKFSCLKDYLAQLVLFRTATDLKSSIYKNLRSSPPYIYGLDLDTDILLTSLSIFSLHTVSNTEASNVVIKKIVNYITSDKSMEDDAKNQLLQMKLMSKSILDGSENVFNFLNFYQKISISPENYIKTINAMTLDDVLEQRVRFKNTNYAVVIS